MRARLVLDCSADEFAAACGELGGVLDVRVVDVTPATGWPERRPASIAALGWNHDLPAEPGAAVRVFLSTPEEAHDGERRPAERPRDGGG